METITITRFARILAIVAIIAVIAPAGVVRAQGDITGAVVVSVTDENGAAVAGVELLLSSDAITLSGVTAADGRYRFGLVPANTYMLRATKAGFAPEGLSGIGVGFGTTYTAAMVLSAERFTDEVTVTAAPPQIDTTISTTKDSLSSEFIEEIPLRNRNFEELVNLFPGVSAGMVQGSRSTATGTA